MNTVNVSGLHQPCWLGRSFLSILVWCKTAFSFWEFSIVTYHKHWHSLLILQFSINRIYYVRWLSATCTSSACSFSTAGRSLEKHMLQRSYRQSMVSIRRIWQLWLIKRDAVKRHHCCDDIVHDAIYKRANILSYLLPSETGENVVCQKLFVPHKATTLSSKWWKTSDDDVIPPPDKCRKQNSQQS